MHKLEMRDVSSENESSASPKSDGSSSASESEAEEAVACRQRSVLDHAWPSLVLIDAI